MRKIVISILCSTVLVLLAAGQSQTPTHVESSLDPVNASADNQATGNVQIDQDDAHLKVNADIRKLKPGEYSLKIHEQGDCGDDSKKAGTPLKGGDLGRVTVKEDGWGHLEGTLRNLSLSAVNGKAVILSQSDKVLACGVLKPSAF